jgi:arginine:ornithine antiporter / lysine permease
MDEQKRHKFGLIPLIALTVGTMIGGGAFALPQNLAAHASVGAVLLGWIITGIGMFGLAFVFRNLSHARPDLQNGIYSYAKTGFGRYIGFNSAWGYWLSAWIGNVSYAVLLFSAIGYFFPIFGNGNTLYAIIGSSIFLWCFHFLILRGVKQAAFVNVVTTIAKLVPIVLFIVLVIVFFHIKQFTFNFWGGHSLDLGSVFTQVKSTMLVTLWVFIGIEGATVESSRAKNQSDVGRATIIGLVTALVIYALISLLSFGIVPQSVLAHAKNPSMAFVLQHVVGDWGAAVVNIGLIVSLFGAWLGWTLLCVQLPYDAAVDHAMPAIFGKENKHRSPANALWLSNGLIQLFLIITLFSHSTYLMLIELATSCILLPYLFSALFALKVGFSKKQDAMAVKLSMTANVAAIVATVYAVWLLYAAGIHFLFLSSILYAVGILFFWRARAEQKEKVFTKWEWVLAGFIFVLAIVAILDLAGLLT